jgi:hypothetical protein
MFDKQVIQRFFSGFLSVFRFGVVPIKQVKPPEIEEYFSKIEQDINTSYEELKNSYERE